MSNLTLGIDINNHVVYDIPFSDDTYMATLTAETPATLDVPVGMTKAYIQVQSGTTVLVSPYEISAPTSSFEQTAAQQNVAVRDVRGVGTLYFYPIEDSLVNVSFYKE